MASGVNQTVRLPRARRPASYTAQLVTRCCCFGMWRRQAALALNGTAGVRVSAGKESPSYASQLPTPISPIRATRWSTATWGFLRGQPGRLVMTHERHISHLASYPRASCEEANNKNQIAFK